LPVLAGLLQLFGQKTPAAHSSVKPPLQTCHARYSESTG
jgi:hypothetical protein